MNILLIDKRVQDYETIVAAIDPGLAVGVVFDYYEDTFDTVKARMRELGLTNGTNQISVGLIQHNYNAPMFTMFASADVAPVAQVESQDPDLAAWTQFRDFIICCKTEFNAAHFDLMACAIYSDPDWKYVIDTLTAQTGVTVRASTDDTGTTSLGGDWFLESHTGVNLKTVYFTEAIEEYRGIFANQGEYFTVVITTTGLIYAEGSNLYGQLGVGDTNDRTTFTSMPLPTNKTPKMHACGRDHTIVLMTDGTLYGTGYNAQGQLGVGDTTNRSTLTQMSIPAGKVVKSIACGGLYTNVLMTDGTVYGTGSTPGAITFRYSPGGQGFGDKSTLTALEFPDGPAMNVKKIACGGAHTVFITNNGSLFGVGDNSSRQLGGIWTGPNYYMTPNYYWDYDRTTTKPITNSTGKTPANVICGNFNTIIVMTDGTRYGLGNSSGLGVTSNNANEISLVLNSVNTVADVISSGTYYSMLLMTNGLIYGAGSNQNGRLGINISNSTIYSSMVQMVNATGKTPKSVACGSFHTIVLMTDGTIYGTGAMGYGIRNSDRIQLTILPVPGNALVASIGQPLVVNTVLSTFTVPTSKKFGDAPFNIIAPLPTSASSEIVTYISNNPDVATIDSSGVIRIIGIGDVNFNALQSATEDYTSATVTSNTLTVSLGTPTLSTFSVETPKMYGDASFNNFTRPTSDSSGAITYTSSNTAVATIDASGNFITLVGGGTVYFIATQLPTTQYASAVKNSNTLTVSRATTSLTSFSVAESKTFGAAPFSIDTAPTSDSSGAITYSSNATNVATIDPSSGIITLVAAGTATFTASQAESPQYNAPTPVTSNTLTVSKGTTTLAFVSPPTTKSLTDPAFTVVASSASSGAVTYTSSNTAFATVGATSGLVTLKGVGTVTITAAQAESAQYNAPTNTTCSIVISSVGSTLAGQTVTRGRSFAGLNLSGASLVGTTLSGVSFSGATLTNANFSGATITGTDFTNANISGATNLPAFSPVQKLQLLKNINNVAIEAVQITTVNGSVVDQLLSTPIAGIDTSTFLVVTPTTVDASSNKTVTITSAMIGSSNVYVPVNTEESIVINGTLYRSNGTNIVDANDAIVNFVTIDGVPFRVYAGSFIGINRSNSPITVIRGMKYILSVNASGHPFWIQTVSGAYSSNNIYSNSSIVNNGSSIGNIIWDVPFDSPNTLYYACQNHSSMQGIINIVDGPSGATSSGASGAVTYTSSNTAKATVGLTTGLVTLFDTGPVTITAAQAASSQYNAPTNTTFTMTIGAAENLAGTVVTTSLASKNLTGASLVGTNLTNISLENANLRNADLSGAVVTGASFINTDISGATNLPVFSTTQKLQLMRNANNAGISAVQISTTLSGAEINAAITTPIPDISDATFVVKAPSFNASNERVVTVTAQDVSNNASLYIPMNSNETVKVNGVAYTFDGTNILDSGGSVTRFITVLGKPFRLYAGSIVGLNVADQLNNIKISGDGLYDIMISLFATKT